MTKAKVAGEQFNPKRLLALRRRLGLSVRQFGGRIGRTGSMIQAMETGHSAPSMETLKRIAREFKVDLREFFV